MFAQDYGPRPITIWRTRA